MLAGAGWLVAVIPASFVVFIVAAFVLRRDGKRVRAFYLLLVVFVAVLLGMSAVGGIGRAVGLAVSDPRSTIGTCGEFDLRPAGARLEAQGPPAPPRPPVFTLPPTVTIPPEFRQPREIPLPTFVIVTPPPLPDIGELPQPKRVDCPEASGRKGAAPLAARSGALLLAAVGIGWTHARGARTMLNEEDRNA